MGGVCIEYLVCRRDVGETEEESHERDDGHVRRRDENVGRHASARTE